MVGTLCVCVSNHQATEKEEEPAEVLVEAMMVLMEAGKGKMAVCGYV